MKIVLLFSLFGASLAKNLDLVLEHSKYSAEIKSEQITWESGTNFGDDMPPWQLEVLVSGVKWPDEDDAHTGYLHYAQDYDESESVPETFDAREHWPYCQSIREIGSQSVCGGCWAFASAEVMSDRICIATNGTKQPRVSVQDLLTCGSKDGCDGGQPLSAFKYWHDVGLTTGGFYNETDKGCKAYSIPDCGIKENIRLPMCMSKPATPMCRAECDNLAESYEDSKTYGQMPYTPRGEKQIQWDLYKHGPVVASFTVYDDFRIHRSEVYRHINNHIKGHHAVKLIGWGVQDGQPYWLAANSWSTRYGDKGFFKILRGQNECDIEQHASAALPDLTRLKL